MNLRSAIRYLLPPALLDLYRWIRDKAFLRLPPEWEYLPAWPQNGSDPKIKGWNAPGVLDTYQAKWPAFLASVEGTRPLGGLHEANKPGRLSVSAHNITMSFGYALARAAWQKERLSLLDWGGGIGHYYVIARALMPELEIEYHCRDLSLLVEYGRVLFPEARFYADDACLERLYDLVLVSSSLQYSRDWRNTLKGLARATGGYCFVTRLPVVEHADSYVLLQRPYLYRYDTEYCGWCLNRSEVIETAEQAGLKLEREFFISHEFAVPRAPEAYHYWGFLFRRVG